MMQTLLGTAVAVASVTSVVIAVRAVRSQSPAARHKLWTAHAGLCAAITIAAVFLTLTVADSGWVFTAVIFSFSCAQSLANRRDAYEAAQMDAVLAKFTGVTR